MTVVEIVASVALLSGGLLAVLAGLGLVRLPDVGARLQAATKPQVLGVVLICLGAGLVLGGSGAVALALVALFQLATAPVVAQLVGRSAHRAGQGRDQLIVDELSEHENRSHH